MSVECPERAGNGQHCLPASDELLRSNWFHDVVVLTGLMQSDAETTDPPTAPGRPCLAPGVGGWAGVTDGQCRPMAESGVEVAGATPPPASRACRKGSKQLLGMCSSLRKAKIFLEDRTD